MKTRRLDTGFTVCDELIERACSTFDSLLKLVNNDRKLLEIKEVDYNTVKSKLAYLTKDPKFGSVLVKDSDSDKSKTYLLNDDQFLMLRLEASPPFRDYLEQIAKHETNERGNLTRIARRARKALMESKTRLKRITSK